MDEGQGQIRIGRRCFRSIWNIDPMSINFARIEDIITCYNTVLSS